MINSIKYKICHLKYFIFCITGIKPRVSQMLGKDSVAELYPSRMGTKHTVQNPVA